MESQRINPTVAVQRSLSLTARLILFSILSLSVCPGLVIASHQTTASPQPAQPQPVQQPTKAGSGGTAEAMSGGIGASTSSFSIQSFNADLYSGTAGADIPIVVPPGAAGVAPKIALRYSSGVVDDTSDELDKDQASWAGLGWTLESGGYVLRDTKGTTGTADDKFKLIFGGDVHDLVSIGSGNYRTKDETFLAIKFISAQDYWTVTTKDGTIHRFGFTANSRATGLTFGPNVEVAVTFRYFIDEATTTSGVSTRYSYFKQSSSYNKKAYDQAVYPDTITYAYYNNSVVGTARTVTFLRAARTDWTNQSASQHTSYHELDRLDAIEVKVGASLVRRYNFAYDYSVDRFANHTWGGGATGDLTLKNVTTLGSDGLTALPAQTFSYSGTLLGSVDNGIGGSVSLSYEKIDAIYSRPALYWDSEGQSWECGSSIEVATTSNEHLCQYTPLVTSTPPVATVPIYNSQLWVFEDQTWTCGATYLAPSANSNCDYSIFGYVRTAPTVTATVPLYTVVDQYWDPEGQSWECGSTTRFTTVASAPCAPAVLVGYVQTGTVDKPRHRVLSRTVSDGRGWSAATNYHYFDSAVGTNPVDFKLEFRGHAKVRTVDPLGNYSETFFYQDDLKKGRPYQTEVRSVAGALYNKTVHTFATSNPYTGVTWVKLTRSDYFECEGQATCHQNAETFTYDIYGNPTQKVDLGDVPTTGDERTEVTEWIVDTTKWMHRPKRTALLDNVGPPCASVGCITTTPPTAFSAPGDWSPRPSRALPAPSATPVIPRHPPATMFTVTPPR